MKSSENKNTAAQEIWIKGFYLILFGIIGYISIFLIFALAIFQFFSQLITGKPNQHLLVFGQSLSTYLHQITQYLTFNSQEKVFPFNNWPGADSSRSLPKK